jgi:hypothetical protein
MRQFRRNLFRCASRTRREQSIRPKISRIDFDLTELERFEVFAGRGVPLVDFHTGDRFLTQTDELVRRDMERTLAMSARATTAPGGRRSTSAFATPLASPVAKRAAIRPRASRGATSSRRRRSSARTGSASRGSPPENGARSGAPRRRPRRRTASSRTPSTTSRRSRRRSSSRCACSARTARSRRGGASRSR